MFLTEQSGARPKVSVVVPNFNGIQHLPECLGTLSTQSFSGFEVVMVDNASTDDSVAWVRTNYPEVRVVQRQTNGGPVKSVNDGVLAARGEYVVVLDNDTAVDSDWLAALVRALDENPDYDFAASMMIFYWEEGILQAAGDSYCVSRLYGLNRGAGRPISEFPQTQRVLSANGGAAMYRRSLFDQVGLYDEDFYWISEDVDFGLRCLVQGKKCLYVPGARVRHKVGVCRQVSLSWDVEKTMIRNASIVAAKNLPLPLLAVGLLAVGWRELRQTLPLRPSYYRRYPELIRLSSKRAAARREGLRIGWAKRGEVWRARKASRIEICRWLLKGYGPVR